jgi:dephospho-CoA kinase
MLKIALTGGIATGKSHVLERFRALGLACLDADALARGVTEAGTEAAQAIAARFGPDILDDHQAVDRAKLAAIVFADDRARRDLESIVHPGVYRAIAAGMRAFERLGAPLVVVDVPLLYETRHEGDYDAVIATTAAADVQHARLRSRGLSDAESLQRLAAQMSAAEKAARADFVITTDSTFEETERQIAGVLAALKARVAATRSA